MGAGKRGVGVLFVGALLGGMLALAPPAGAGGDTSADADGTQPEHGVTYRGKASGLSAELTAMAPIVDGRTELRVHIRLECGDVRGSSADDETLKEIVELDGSFSIDLDLSSEGGGSRRSTISLSGTFTDARSTTARFSYDLFDEDDDNNTTACKKKGEMELSGGRANRGLRRLEIAVPIEADLTPEPGDDPPTLDGQTVTSPDAVFVGLTRSGNDAGADETALFRIDPTTNQLVAQQTVPRRLELVFAGSSLYGVDGDNGTLVPIDPGSLTAGAPIQIAPPRQEQDEDFAFPVASPAVATDGSLWLAAVRDREIVRFDPTSNAVTARSPIDAYPRSIAAGPAGLYVESQSTIPFADSPTTHEPQTNVVRRVDPATGAVLATSPTYQDDSIGEVVATADAVVFDVLGGGGDKLVSLDPTTLALGPTAKPQYPFVGAPPGVWTATDRSSVRGLRPDLSREIDVPFLASGSRVQAGAGFGAIWVFYDDMQSVYRLTTR